MSQYYVKLPIQPASYQQLLEINQHLDDNHSGSIAKSLGANFTALTREVMHQAFESMVQQQLARQPDNQQAHDTLQVLHQIDQMIGKHMPWSISLLGNDRLKPVARYILQHIDVQEGVYRLTYPISDDLHGRIQHLFVRLEAGDDSIRTEVFSTLTEVIDSGVTTLLRQPKDLLRFNFVVSKTLDGILTTITSLGYKRLEKIGQHMTLEQAQEYASHFQQFIAAGSAYEVH